MAAKKRRTPEPAPPQKATWKEWLGLGEHRQLGRGEAFFSSLFAGLIGGAIAWIFISRSTALAVIAIALIVGVYREIKQNQTR